MANIKKGVTAFWWLEDLALGTAAYTGAVNAYASATGTLNFQSTSGSRKSDRGELRDKSNNVVGEGYSNDGHDATFDGIPSGASLATAKTVNILPQAGNVLCIIDTSDVYLGDVSPGIAWIVDSSDWSGDLSKPRHIVIKCHRWADVNVSKDAV